MDKLGKGYMFIYSALSLTVLSPGKGCEKRNKPWFLEGKTEFFTILVSEVSRGKPNLNEMKLERRLVGFLLLSPSLKTGSNQTSGVKNIASCIFF